MQKDIRSPQLDYPFQSRNRRHIFFGMVLLWAFISILLRTAAVSAQQDTVPGKVMELNRQGQWEQAAQVAESFLTSSEPKSPLQRCQTYVELAYAETRLSRVAEAQHTLTIYDKDCGKLAPDGWMNTEVTQLRAELTPKPQPQPKVTDDNFWLSANAGALGMNVKALNLHEELCARSGADACLIVYQGRIVQEHYSSTYKSPMFAMSSTKSITGLLVGMLIDDGKIKSLDEPVCTYLKEWCAGPKAKVTLRHLLTMTSGLPRMYAEGVASVGDKDPFVTGLPLATEPGTTWAYSNEGVQLLSPILDKAAGEPIQEYARKRLFEPLGMGNTRLHLDAKHHAWTYADMETTPRDFARIGVLMLNKGVWQGKRIVSESWVNNLTMPSQSLNARYGLLWWLFPNSKAYAALGYLDTNLYVFPEKDLIVIRMQGKPLKQPQPYEGEALKLFDQLTQK